jgi:hypothetical protein
VYNYVPPSPQRNRAPYPHPSIESFPSDVPQSCCTPGRYREPQSPSPNSRRPFTALTLLPSLINLLSP